MSKVPLYPSRHEIAALVMVGGPAEPLAEKMADWANAGDPAAVEMLNLLMEEGELDESGKFSDKLFDTIESLTADIRLSMKPVVDRKYGDTFQWAHAFLKTDFIPSSKAAYALAIASLVNSFETDRIHQCTECGKYFIGDRRSTWCSKACGNRSRQRAFQERKRAKKKRSKK